MGLSLLLLQEVDDESLVVHYEVVREPFCLQIVTKVFAPVRVKGLQSSKLRGASAIGSVRSRR